MYEWSWVTNSALFKSFRLVFNGKTTSPSTPSFSLLMAFLDLACLFIAKGLSLHIRFYRGSEILAVSPVHCLVCTESFFWWLLMRTVLSCSRINVIFIIESTFHLQHYKHGMIGKNLATLQGLLNFLFWPAVVVMLKELPCPDNVKLIPQIVGSCCIS